jgi:hypothetical protein
MTTMEVSSRFLTEELVALFRTKYDLSGSGDEGDIVAESVGEGEFVTTVNINEPHFFYMYSSLIHQFNLFFPFTEFESSMLRVPNVAHIQLHPNSWPFIKAFELVCLGLEINSHSVAVFFSFYHIKNLVPNVPVSLCSQPNRGLFSLYSFHFKYYKDTFTRIRYGQRFPDVMFYDDGEPLFPFYWTTSPRIIRGAVYERLSEFERDTMAYLETLNQMSISDLLDAECSTNTLEGYVSK